MALLNKAQRWLTGGIVLLLVAVSFYAVLQDRALDDMRRDRDAAVRQRQAAERTMVVMADQHAAALLRTEIHGENRAAILAAPAEEDGPVSPILMKAMRGADRIGGITK